jgi:carbamoyltransferase
VTAEDNPDAYAVLTAYERLTGSPILVNTSFNMHEEPIVCTPQDAIRAFLLGHLDALSIGSFIALRPEDRAPR